MSKTCSVAIIGCGTMGAAIARAILQKQFTSAASLLLVDQDKARVNDLAMKLDCHKVELDDTRLTEADIVILAVKPQDSATACASIRSWLSPRQIVVSIMAGVSVDNLSHHLAGHKIIVRSMPNLPARFGEGMTVYYANDSVGQQALQHAQSIFESFGTSVRVAQEDLINGATALSGTGPAYFYFLLHQMQTVAEELGYSPEQADVLLKQTMKGALALWEKSGISPYALIGQIASRGGTTEAALKTFSEENVGEGLQKGVRAAHHRSRELAT